MKDFSGKKIYLSILALLILLIGGGCGSGEEWELEATVTPVKYDRSAIVTIMSDDGNFESGVMYDGLCRKHNVRMTIAGIGMWIEPHLTEWKEMERQLELISHSWSHIYMGEDANVSEEELQYQLTDSIKWFSENFSTDQIAFVAPEVAMSQRGYEILDENGIISVRIAGDTLNYFSKDIESEEIDWKALGAISLSEIETAEQMNAWVDRAVADNAWMIWMWHNVTETGKNGGYEEISYEMVDSHMSYLVQKQLDEDIWVAPFVEATKYVYERENATIKAFYNGQNIKIVLECDTKKLKSKQMDEELTVKIALPENVEMKYITEKNPKLNLKIVEEASENYILLEMLPNSKVKIKL